MACEGVVIPEAGWWLGIGSGIRCRRAGSTDMGRPSGKGVKALAVIMVRQVGFAVIWHFLLASSRLNEVKKKPTTSDHGNPHRVVCLRVPRCPSLASDLHVANGRGLPFDFHAKCWREFDTSKFEEPTDYSPTLVECILILSAAPAMPIAYFWFGHAYVNIENCLKKETYPPLHAKESRSANVVATL